MNKLSFNGTSYDNSFYKTTKSKSLNSDQESLYLASNDEVELNSISQSDGENVFIGIANPHYFHVLCILLINGHKFSHSVAIDYSFKQLIHFHHIKETIIASKNRVDFLQKLYCVKFNKQAIKTLSDLKFPNGKLIRGSKTANDGYDAAEEAIWNNLYFDAKLFKKTYKVNAYISSKGIVVQSHTVGDINNYYATIISGHKQERDLWPFTLAYGSGYLHNEKYFRVLKNYLLTNKNYEIHGDVSSSLEPLLYANRYSSIIFWASNVFDDYFIKKSKNLKKLLSLITDLSSRLEPKLPEIDLTVIHDRRSKTQLPYSLTTKRKVFSPHTSAFRILSQNLIGDNNLELVNQDEWIRKDKGESKLYLTRYMHIRDYEKCNGRYSTIILHGLVSHGCDKSTFFKIAKKALKNSDKLIILEHNAESKDFDGKKIGFLIQELRSNFKKEKKLFYSSGVKSNNRNIIAIY